MQGRARRLGIGLAALVVLVAAAVGARPAAACSKRHQSLFELFDLAADVAVVRVGKVPRAHYAGPVSLRVEERLKGGKKKTLVATESNTSCATGFRGGRRALVFLDRDRGTTGAYEGYLESPTDALLTAVRAWSAAATPAARAAVLVGVVGSDDRQVALDAAYYLADHPELIAVLTAEQTSVLVAARGDRRTDEWIALVLARQHGDAWRAMIAAGSLPAGPITALAAHDLEAITDTGALADRIAAATGELSTERIAAFERCERVHGRALASISSYGRGRSDHGWAMLVTACRTGTPTPY